MAAERGANGDAVEVLRGWKEIADNLKISTRTAQRYEREFALPVRRKAERFGTGVYMLRKDLTAWLEANPGITGNGSADGDAGAVAPVASVAGSKAVSGRRFRLGILLAAVLSILVVSAIVGYGLVSPKPRLASWEIRQNRLVASDSEGRTLWQRTFPVSLDHRAYQDYGNSPHPAVLIEDLDGDGPAELLFLALEADPNVFLGFYCFNADGSVRFSVTSTNPKRESVQFGERRFDSPIEPVIFHVGRDLRGNKSVFVVSQIHTWFPAVVRKFSPAGRLLAEFWHNGHVTRLLDATVAGRRVLLAGAMNNEHTAAALAVLDYDNPTGHAPASNPKFLCRDCPPGAPLAYLVFPRSEVSRALDSRPFVKEMKMDPSSALTLVVSEGQEKLAQQSDLLAYVIYGLDQRFGVLNAEVDDDYRATHTRLTLAGKLDHPMDRAVEEKELREVLFWLGDRFGTASGAAAAAVHFPTAP